MDKAKIMKRGKIMPSFVVEIENLEHQMLKAIECFKHSVEKGLLDLEPTFNELKKIAERIEKLKLKHIKKFRSKHD